MCLEMCGCSTIGNYTAGIYLLPHWGEGMTAPYDGRPGGGLPFAVYLEAFLLPNTVAVGRSGQRRYGVGTDLLPAAVQTGDTAQKASRGGLSSSGEAALVTVRSPSPSGGCSSSAG